MNTRIRFGLLALTSFALTACPPVPPADPLAPSPSVVTFSASATQVTAGSTVTLSWKVENATSIRIDDLALGQVSGVAGNEGTVDVAVGNDTTYLLSARNDRGASDSALISVRVNGAARELLFVAVPDAIASGGTTTLAWSAPGAASVTITAVPGGPVDVRSQTASGSVTVSPAQNTTYTLTAGSRTRETTVTVVPTIVTFNASGVATDGGSDIHLEWTTSGATRVRLTGAGRGELLDSSDAARVASGTFSEPLPTAVDPGQYFSYELTATGPGGASTRTIIYAVPGKPVVTSFTGPAVARNADGGTVTLAWQTLEAASVSIAVAGVEFYRAGGQRGDRFAAASHAGD